MPEASPALTPMMQQLDAVRRAHPGMLVLFQNGEFYELFGDDAISGSRLLGLTLTRRDDVPMAGFPLNKLEHYLKLLLAAGQRVAVVEQMEPAAETGKKIIRREVTRVVTPGTAVEEELLDPRQANHLVAMVDGHRGMVGLAWLDLSSGSFHAADFPEAKVADELARLHVGELLIPERDADRLLARLNSGMPVTMRPDWCFEPLTARRLVQEHFRIATLAGFGFDDAQPCVTAAGAVLSYLRETLKSAPVHLRRLQPYRAGDQLVLDEVTRRSLELTRSLRDQNRDGSLLAVLDRTITPMGARFLQEALLAPLCNAAAIEERLDAVGELRDDHGRRANLRENLKLTADLQRLTSRAATARATPRDLGAIASTLRQLPKVKQQLGGMQAALLKKLNAILETFEDLRQILDTALQDELPISSRDGGFIREGYNPELDELRRLARDGKTWIAQYQAQESLRTGIANLKIGFTSVLGYYIEVTNSHEHKVPADYVHERTLKNCKRYVTRELKEYEDKVLSAEEKSQALEHELFIKLRDHVAGCAERLMAAAEVLATIDFLAALAELAANRNYTRPVISSEPVLNIRGGRHPVLDVTLPPGTLVPNDCRCSAQEGLFWLITGPNMSGKSTFIRQVALITLMAHLGSFVPAQAAEIGLTDRIFTRVGASDELSRGQSTFMVEMTETANILNNATARSLVILDEIGRGTSTYDGVSLAWAITEHLHDVIGCRALFATHYHELAQLAEVLPRLRNYTVRVEERGRDVFFSHLIVPGHADKSYGLQVARLAGVPEHILERAQAVLQSLESPHQTPVQAPRGKPRLRKAQPNIRSLFELD